MIRTLFLVISILAVAVMPNPAHGGGGGTAATAAITTATATSIHFGGFFVVSYVYAPYLYYPYPVYPPPAVLEEPPVVYQQPAVQREVIYPNGKYVLYGDGVNQPAVPMGLDPGCP
jgi:hypothetical protein